MLLKKLLEVLYNFDPVVVTHFLQTSTTASTQDVENTLQTISLLIVELLLQT